MNRSLLQQLLNLLVLSNSGIRESNPTPRIPLFLTKNQPVNSQHVYIYIYGHAHTDQVQRFLAAAEKVAASSDRPALILPLAAGADLCQDLKGSLGLGKRRLPYRLIAEGQM